MINHLYNTMRPSIKASKQVVSYLNRKAYSSCSVIVANNITYIRNRKSNNRRNVKGDKLFSTSAITSQASLDNNNMIQFDTLHELQKNACIAYSNSDLFGTYTLPEITTGKEKGEFQWMTYKDFDDNVNKCRTVLKDLGVEEFSKIGVISNNRWEWAAVATAAYSLNATLVPMYEAQTTQDWLYILNDSQSSVVFCATPEIYDQVTREVIPSAPSVKNAVCFDAELGEEYAFKTHMERANKQEETNIIKPTPDDLANLIYTSGTTGKPKGVELMHSNTVSNAKGLTEMVPNLRKDLIRIDDRSLAFLPWAHSYGQTCELWLFMMGGASMGICRGVPTILEDLQLVKPTTLFSVPTLYKKVFDGVNNLVESSSPTKQKLMKKAFELGRKKYNNDLGFLEKVQFSLLDGIVLSKVRDRFGGNLRHGFCAGAAVPKEVLAFMDDIGIPIYEGYGLTETSPIIALNVPGSRKVGAVGSPLSGVKVVIADEEGNPVLEGQEGEICCYGPNVMKGYYNNPEATAEVMSIAPDGVSKLFHTGDLGRMGSDGFVHVTGRLKEQYKLENGKYICPTPIEEAIGMSRFIMQVVLCGANRPHNVALLVLDWAAIRSELKILDDVTEDELVNDRRVKRLIDSEIKSSCKGKLKKFEIPQEWAMVAPFTAANNMLTPKMSIRRHVVIKTYEDVINVLYRDAVVAGGADGTSEHREAA